MPYLAVPYSRSYFAYAALILPNPTAQWAKTTVN